ncbi:MAG: hypothetical protein ABGY96_09840 [bacterium]
MPIFYFADASGELVAEWTAHLSLTKAMFRYRWNYQDDIDDGFCIVPL